MVKPKNKHSLSHVRHDPAHCLAPGLFRALKRGERKRSKLDVTYDYGDGKRIEFSGPEPLGADDLRILQGLVAMAGPNGLVLGPEPKTEGGRQLRLFLEPKWEAVTADAMVVKGSYRALAKEIGAEVDSGGALKHIQDCIERLWKVSIIAQNGRKRQGFRLLSEYASDEADGRLYVALNPLIAQAVMGGGQHVRISMDEVRALDSETARLLHQRLCGWIDPGKTGKASIDTLCGYVWPSEASGSTMRKRRQRVPVSNATALSLIPAWGFFWGLLPKPRSRCWRGSMNCGCASICRCFCLFRANPFCARSQAVVRGMSGPRHSLQSLPPPQVELTSSAHTSRAPCATGWRYWRR